MLITGVLHLVYCVICSVCYTCLVNTAIYCVTPVLVTGVLHLGSCRFGGGPLGALFLAPHGAHLALVLMGNSPEAMQDVVSLAAPTIPPMTRSPVSLNTAMVCQLFTLIDLITKTCYHKFTTLNNRSCQLIFAPGVGCV